jgi:hypothetical protein
LVGKRAALAFFLCTVVGGCRGGDPADAGPDPGDASCEGERSATLFSDTGQYLRELYVDRTRGHDDGDGSRAQPWRSLARASLERQAGDRVHIAAGTYFDCLHIEGARGTEAHPIMFTGEGEVRIHCQNGEAVWGTGLSFVTFQKLIVLASSDGANAFHIDDRSDHIVLRNNEVTGVGRAGDCIKVNQSDDIWILDNDLHNADTATGSSQGIDLVAVHRALLAGNHVHDIRDSQGIFAKGGASDVVIERNLIERIESESADAIGIVVGGMTDPPFFVPQDAPYEATRVIARNNIIIGADGAGIGAQGCHDCWIVNNTLWNTGHHGYAIQLSQGATGPGAGGNGVSVNVNVRVMNNLIGNPYGTMRAPIQAEEGQRTELQLSHNWWWNGERDDVFDPGYNHVVGVDEPHSFLDEDPEVVNWELPDVRLSAHSRARGAGRDLPNVRGDFEGRCRHSPPDIGALQAR